MSGPRDEWLREKLTGLLALVSNEDLADTVATEVRRRADGLAGTTPVGLSPAERQLVVWNSGLQKQ